ncbi:sugar-binding protein [Pseudomonas sp. SWRI12]|uniref:RHS repeat-associated core domain-containing protein n=1 Tax=Pseudomonas zanjanensis TaxID=2745496 RepID=A0A923FL09_9PSED|nr:RHS repeat-associated core domain-containing protein [Pseudomonas zanjanensis]MBV4496811.1 sugar-binding protein [Pseudomonas zanjanensis]
MTTSTAVHSNAFNFMSFIQTGVDPRTGLYTVSLSLPDLFSNDLRGPSLPLALNYNPLNTNDSGFGKGWNLALSQYTPSSQIVSVYSGQTFKVTGPYEGVANRMRMKEQKIEEFQFYQLPDGQFKIVHKSGLVEVLELKGASPQVAVPVAMYSPQGHKITLEYVTVGSGAPMLSAIRDSNGQLLKITRNLITNTVTLGFNPVNGVPLAEVVLSMKEGNVDRITLPTTENAGWRFKYLPEKGLDCISEVWTPLGAHETVQYNDAGHGFPGDEQRKLPRVTDHITEPGADQRPITVKYTYSANGHNFLGYPNADWTDDGLDNLYKVLNRYEYETTEQLMVGNDAVRSVTRRFNRFHLLVSETTVQGMHQQTQATRYYANDTDGISFDAQPRQCQLPNETITRWELTNDPREWRQDVETSEYDIYGNQTLSVQTSGVTEATSYYPSGGVPGKCPADPYGFVKHVEHTTVTPTTDSELVPDVQTGAPTLRTRYSYVELRPLDPDPDDEEDDSEFRRPWAVISEESSYHLLGQTEVLLETSSLEHFNATDDPLRHGLERLKTLTMVGRGDQYVSTTEYAYRIKTDEEKAENNKTNQAGEVLLGEPVLLTTETFTGHDGLVKVVSAERSLLNGEPLLTQDKDIKIRNTYDALMRVLTETVAPDDPDYAATRTYTYRLVRPTDDGSMAGQAFQEVENVKQIKTRTWFDGFNRAIREEQQDADFSNGAYRDIYQATYNALGQLTEEREIDWLELQPLSLTTTYTFDDWGQQSSSTDPAGVKQHTVEDPIAFTTTEWTEGMGKTVTTNNRLEKPVSVQRFDLEENSVSLHTYLYDGLGRTVQEKNAARYETSYTYDVFDRMLETTLPTGHKVVREYAGHSRSDLPTLIKVGATELGTQAFDSLERLTQSTTGGRVTRHEYDTTYSKANRVIQPSGDVIHYEYAYELTDEPLTRNAVAGEQTVSRLKEMPKAIQATYEYDPKDARLTRSSEIDIELGRTYDGQGELKSEMRTVTDGAGPYEMTYVHSRLGRLIRYQDVTGQVQVFDYDRTNGRLNYTQLSVVGNESYIRSDFTYNGQGLMERIETVDYGNTTVIIDLEYDALGRETLRTFNLNGSTSWLKQVWNGLDQIERRELSEGASQGDTLLRKETYSYELRGRLEEYRCEGPQAPVDPFGYPMTRQLFFFDALDNHDRVRTFFIKGQTTEDNTAIFVYNNPDPAQLTRVTNSHADYPDIELEYDANGNLIKDEEGRTLSYDLLSRLVEVSGPGSDGSRFYGYDGGDQLSASGSDGDREQQFYRNGTPVNSVGATQSRTYVSADGVMLAEHQEGAGPKSLLLAGDYSGSVLREVDGGEVREIAYAAYGYRDAEQSVASRPGYNGEVRDETGWYLLGNGYRAFNPRLMRFHSPDSWSPFGEGGVNAYAYCRDPVNFTDPTGHGVLSSLRKFFGFKSKSSVAKRVDVDFGDPGLKSAMPDAKRVKYNPLYEEIGVPERTPARVKLVTEIDSAPPPKRSDITPLQGGVKQSRQGAMLPSAPSTRPSDRVRMRLEPVRNAEPEQVQLTPSWSPRTQRRIDELELKLDRDYNQRHDYMQVSSEQRRNWQAELYRLRRS